MADQILSGDRADLTNGLAALDKLSWFWKRFLSLHRFPWSDCIGRLFAKRAWERGVDEKGWRLFSGLASGQEDAADDPEFGVWLNQLLLPGASLGGARPKASVIDPEGRLWIAKFPSGSDDRDIGGWEAVVNELALRAGLNVAKGQARRLTRQHHTFLTRRFDRDGDRRIHFASAMTLLGRTDGADAAISSYLELAECIARVGARTNSDLEELWRRIVFNICISNADDHLRNHGFLLTSKGWVLSPAYDLNPVPDAQGLTLNIDGNNALDIKLVDAAPQFRVKP